MKNNTTKLLGLTLLGGGIWALAGCTRPPVVVGPGGPNPPGVGSPGNAVAAVVTERKTPAPPPPPNIIVATTKIEEKPELLPNPSVVEAKVQEKPAPPPMNTVVAEAKVQEKPAPPASGEPFRFPGDKGGQELGQLLRPSLQLPLPLEDLPPGPRQLTPLACVDHPLLPLPSSPAGPIGPPLPKALPVRPHMLAEGSPLSAYRDDPLTPDWRELATGVAVALPIRDLREPVVLGYLGLPSLDRIPLEDPTVEASLASALAANPPDRTTPVPFNPQNLPDPFQYAQTVKVHAPLPEDVSPLAGTPRLPPAPTPQPAPKQ